MVLPDDEFRIESGDDALRRSWETQRSVHRRGLASRQSAGRNRRQIGQQRERLSAGTANYGIATSISKFKLLHRLFCLLYEYTAKHTPCGGHAGWRGFPGLWDVRCASTFTSAETAA